MPLNYSKWDQLELSDDSDIEGHPNVDKKSLIRWKQRDIHEKREARKHRILQYETIIRLNNVLLPRVEKVLTQVKAGGAASFSSIAEQLKTNPSPEAPPRPPPPMRPPGDYGDEGEDDAPVVTYDEMVLQLMLQIFEDVKKRGVAMDSPTIGDELVKELGVHVGNIKKSTADSEKALEEEKKEQKKHITSDDIHDGFDKSAVSKVEKPVTLPTIPAAKSTKKETTIEVLNPKADTKSPQAPAEDADDEDDDDEEIPQLTPALEGFSKIGVGEYLKSYEYIQKRPMEIIVAGAYDALLVAGFQAAMRGQDKYAKQCTHQALLIQYCEKLGRDGVQMFFTKMIQGDKRAITVFINDVEETYRMMHSRASKAAKDTAQGGKETIQLVAEDPSHTISFNVPDGPPPPLESLQLSGPGTESLDKEEVHKMLNLRWEIYQGFDKGFQEALKKGSLDDVNELLGEMEVEMAEAIVQQLDMAGILSFSKSGIVDETPAGKAAAAAAAASEEAEKEKGEEAVVDA